MGTAKKLINFYFGKNLSLLKLVDVSKLQLTKLIQMKKEVEKSFLHRQRSLKWVKTTILLLTMMIMSRIMKIMRSILLNTCNVNDLNTLYESTFITIFLPLYEAFVLLI